MPGAASHPTYSHRIQGLERAAQEGLDTKLHLVVDAYGMPVRTIVTEGTVADCSQASTLIKEMDADTLPADLACDTDAIVAHCMEREMEPVIPSERNYRNLRQSMTGTCTD